MRDVLLVTTDSLRARHVGYHGYERDVTPELDALAAQGSRFMNAYSHGGNTKLSFPGILSGVTPLMYGGYGQITGDQTLVSEVFNEAGYRTGGFHSNLYVSAKFGYDRGWDEFYDSAPEESAVSRLRKWAKTSLDGPLLDLLKRSYDYLESSRGINVGSYHVPANKLTDRAIEFIERTAEIEAPTFLWIHYMDVHHPFLPPEEYQRQFLGKPVAPERSIQLRRKFIEKPDEVTEAERETFIDLYDACIRFNDAEIGRLIDAVDAVWGDDYLLGFTSDHGDHFLEHGYFGGADLRNIKNHVPLFMSGWDDEGEYDELVGLTDLPTTLVDAVDLPVPDNWFGHSLRELVFDGQWERTDVAGGYRDDDTEHLRVREEDWKLINHGDAPDELYHLVTDPDEEQNVIGDHPEEAERLRERLDDHRRLVASTSDTDVERPEVGEDVKQRLRRLGYDE